MELEEELLFKIYGIKGYDVDAGKSPENEPGDSSYSSPQKEPVEGP